ncbi:hypothetical protein BH11VER1_BH11VER1_22650 [soil metagenome]
MKRLLSLFLGWGCLAGLQAQTDPVALKSTAAVAGNVIRIEITNNELSDNRRWRELRKQMDQAIAEGASALLFDINVTAGRPQAALPMAEEVARLKVRTLAYVNPSAVSGGALLALGCDEIWMAPGARIGAAAPVMETTEKQSEKTQDNLLAESLAVLKAGARSLCKLKGHNPELAEAFIDREKEFKLGEIVLSAKGELLLLDGDIAVQPVGGKPLLARGQVADIPALMKIAGLPQEIVPLSAALFEKKKESPPVSPDKAVLIKSDEKITTGSFTGKVVIIPVGEEDLISRARFEFMTRTLERCTSEGAEAVIFDLDTPGGLAWDTTNLMMKDLQKLKPRSFAFVNPRALSAGAMIAIATDGIYMSPASSSGAATPIYGNGAAMGDAERAKMNSAIMSMARTVAKEKGHDPRVIEAMIDMDRELVVNGEVLCAKGEILTLDAEQATMLENGRPLFAKGIVKSLDEIKKAEGLTGATIIAKPSDFEQIAIWVTKYAAILILIGLAGGYVEMQTPGFGIPGLISLAAFSLFFFGHYVAGSLVGQETAVVAGLFVLGIVLVVLEFLVFPGTMIPGIAGFVCIMIALVYTMSGWEPVPALPVPAGEVAPETVGFQLATYATGLRNFAVGIIGAAGSIVLLARFLPETKPFQKLVLNSAAGGSLETTPAMQMAESVKPGDNGVTRSELRPYGTVEIAQRRVEAMVEGGYLSSGTKVRVREVQGPKIIVEEITA